jgi:hypothetical protein
MERSFSGTSPDIAWSYLLRRNSLAHWDYAAGLEAIEHNAQAQMELIEESLDMSRIMNGKIRLDIQK